MIAGGGVLRSAKDATTGLTQKTRQRPEGGASNPPTLSPPSRRSFCFFRWFRPAGAGPHRRLPGNNPKIARDWKGDLPRAKDAKDAKERIEPPESWAGLASLARVQRKLPSSRYRTRFRRSQLRGRQLRCQSGNLAGRNPSLSKRLKYAAYSINDRSSAIASTSSFISLPLGVSSTLGILRNRAWLMM